MRLVMHQSPSGLWRLPSKQDYRGSESRLVLHFLRHIQRLIELRIQNKRAVYWDLSITDRTSDYESEDVGSIPAGPAILRQ